jgi:glyoxylase-like metal-dependent hydrolase (beta-lactamase superfamily II)
MSGNLGFALGDITVQRVIESEGPGFDPFAFLPTLTPALLDENRHWMQPKALDPVSGNLVICIQSYIVRTPQHTVLVDSCVGNDKQRPGRPHWNMKTDDQYMRGLAGAGVSVEEIDYVMCTHLHVDHVGWNTRLENGRWVPTFPNARYVFADREYAYWTERQAIQPAEHYADSVLPIIEAKRADLVRSDHVLNDYVKLLPTPGHTPDHYAVALGRGSTSAVLTGDLVHSPIQVRYPEMSMFADVDAALAAKTRRSFLETYCDTETLCCTVHFPSPSVTRIKCWGEGFKCEMVE